MNEVWFGVMIFMALLLVLLTSMPIAYVMGLFAVVLFVLAVGTSGLPAIGSMSYSLVSDFILVAVPLFMLMAELIGYSGIGGDLFDFGQKWLGRLPGGLASGSIAACAIFGAICGSSVATAATVGTVAIPEMEKRHYDGGLLTGSLAAGGTLGIMIPPSIPMILYGAITQNSVGDLFMAGVIPGILGMIMFIGYVTVAVWLKPKLAPVSSEPVSWSDRLKSLWGTAPALCVIALVLGTIYTGIATPTEAAAVGVIGALFVAVIRRRLNWRVIRDASTATARNACMIMTIIVGALLFGYALTLLEIPQAITAVLVGLPVSRWLILTAVCLLWLVLGMFLEAVSIMYLTLPVLYPAMMALGFDPIWFGIVMVVNMEMAMITPPVGLNVFVIKGIAPQYPIWQIYKGIGPFVAVMVVWLLTIILIPAISLWLPGQMS